MNEILQQMIGMAPGIGQAASGNGAQFASFMEGWQRAAQRDEQRKRLEQQDSLAMEDRSLRLEDRQRGIEREAEAARLAAQGREQQQALQSFQIPGHLAELGSIADDPQGAQALIESAMPRLMKAFGQESMSYGMPAVEMATKVITGRQKKQVEAFVDAALKTSFVADNPDSDPELVQLPEHIARIVGKPSARLSELQQFAALPVGKPAKSKSIANPTAASLAHDAAGGDPMRALELLRPPREPAGAQEPLMAIMGDGGEPVYVPRSQAVGKRPASTREQGRAVTSGDASDIAEFNTALDDVATLRETLKGIKATGTSAAIGAALPNAITEATGWGTDAKQKNAVIARVKQVIGKALEGGVLRKEDESKYAKILPTISDTPEVVATKLDGLEKAIRQRQQNKQDALADAGYDISRFTKRGAPLSSVPTPAPSGGPKVGERRRSPNGDLVEFDGKGWFVVRP